MNKTVYTLGWSLVVYFVTGGMSLAGLLGNVPMGTISIVSLGTTSLLSAAYALWLTAGSPRRSNE